jgi:hypothetical protein
MPTFIHCTPAQFRDRLRALFREEKGWRLVKLGRYIHSLNLTDNQLKNLFNINDTQLAALKTKLQRYRDRYDEIVVEVGE